jgi:uncharacterized phage-like protein YoqJ
MRIAGTGHRPNKLGGYTEQAFNRLVQILKKWLADHPEVDEVVTGMALGFDQALAQAALELGISYIAAVPFQGQESVWKDSDKERYFGLLKKAKKIVYVGTPGYSNAKMHARNHWMVDNCDEILTMHDGSKGGTFACLAYARLRNKKIHNIYNIFYDRQRAI